MEWNIKKREKPSTGRTSEPAIRFVLISSTPAVSSTSSLPSIIFHSSHHPVPPIYTSFFFFFFFHCLGAGVFRATASRSVLSSLIDRHLTLGIGDYKYIYLFILNTHLSLPPSLSSFLHPPFLRIPNPNFGHFDPIHLSPTFFYTFSSICHYYYSPHTDHFQ